jgi:tetratricopeptide (TPR) repeat protein
MRDRTGKRLAFAAGLAVAVAAVFGGALGHGFLPSHDDGAYLLWNPVLRAPLGEAFRGAFTSHPLGAWAPLHLLSHVADARAWGGWAGGYVLVNLLLHCGNALLLAWLVRRLGAPRLAAAGAALLFALHPVQVESVVWISQRKTVLSLAFMLATLHLWIWFAAARPGRRLLPYALSLTAAAAAMLSKAVAVILPLALALADLPLRRASPAPRRLAEKLPFLGLALGVVVVTVVAKGEAGSTLSVGGHTRASSVGSPFAYHGGSPLHTLLTMLTVLPRYLRLLLWPTELSAVYLPPIRTGLDLEVAASILLIVALAVAGLLLLRRSARAFFWYAFFFVGLLPVSQIVPQATLMNDRYLYVPMVGAAALAGEGLAAAVERLAGAARRTVLFAAAAALLLLAVQARARVPTWRDDLSLWTDTVARAPGSPYAWYNLGGALEAAGDDEGALRAYRRALAIDSRDGDAAVNAGAILLRRGEHAEALLSLELGAHLLPVSVEAHFNLGLARFLGGNFEGAAAALRTAASLDPAACPPAVLLGHALTLSGRPGEALERYAALAPRGCSDPGVELYAALAESEQGNDSGAMAILARAIPAAGRLGPEFLRQPTVRVLKAQPGFEDLLRRYASTRSGPAGGAPRPP